MTTYCQPADIAARLQLMEKDGSSRQTFDGNSKPTLDEVTNWIEEEEDWIDEYCIDSWRPKIVANEYRRGERKSNVIGYGGPRAHIVELTNNHIIKPLSNTDGDKLEIAVNNAWVDLVTTGNGEGDVYGHNDFFVEPDRGNIYIYGQTPKTGPGTIRVTYRHGQVSVIKPIKTACILLTCMHLLSGDDYINIFPDNPNNIQLQAKYENFKKEAYMRLDRYRRAITI